MLIPCFFVLWLSVLINASFIFLDATNSLAMELSSRFPVVVLIDAMDIFYRQYWLDDQLKSHASFD